MIKLLWLEIKIFALELECDHLATLVRRSGEEGSPYFTDWNKARDRLLDLRVRRVLL